MFAFAKIQLNTVAFVPGFEHDIFISYCHGDDRAWIRGFYEMLKSALKEQLGVEPGPGAAADCTQLLPGPRHLRISASRLLWFYA